MADLATQLRGSTSAQSSGHSSLLGKGRSDVALTLVASTIIASIAWGLLLVLWGPLAFPSQLGRLLVTVACAVPTALAFAVLAVGFISSRRGTSPAWVRRWVVVAVASLTLGYIAVLTNVPMKVSFAIGVHTAGDPPTKLARPSTDEGKPSGCGKPGSNSGRVYVATADLANAGPTQYPSAPVVYYCPQGIDVDTLMTNHSDFEPMGGPWWIDWMSD